MNHNLSLTVNLKLFCNLDIEAPDQATAIERAKDHLFKNLELHIKTNDIELINSEINATADEVRACTAKTQNLSTSQQIAILPASVIRQA